MLLRMSLILLIVSFLAGCGTLKELRGGIYTSPVDKQQLAKERELVDNLIAVHQNNLLTYSEINALEAMPVSVLTTTYKADPQKTNKNFEDKWIKVIGRAPLGLLELDQFTSFSAHCLILCQQKSCITCVFFGALTPLEMQTLSNFEKELMIVGRYASTPDGPVLVLCQLVLPPIE